MSIGIIGSCIVAYVLFLLLKPGDFLTFWGKIEGFTIEIVVLFVIGTVAIWIEQFKKEYNSKKRY